MKKIIKRKPRRRMTPRARSTLLKNAKIDYKNLDLMIRAVTPNGKIMSRRFTGATNKQQRDLTKAVKRAKFLGLVPVGSTKRF